MSAIRNHRPLGWRGCQYLDGLIREHRRALTRPQVPQYAGILNALQAASESLAVAVESIARHLGDVDLNLDSVWLEGSDGDLSAAYLDASRKCRAAGAALLPLCARVTGDARTWRSRSRPRPARR